VLVGLALYALGTDGVTAALGFVDDAASRWTGAWTALSAVVLAAGLFPTFFVDQALAANPIVLPRGAGGRAARAGLATAFALSLLFPLNYVARSDAYRVEVDYSYFRVTDVGDATRSIVRTLTEPVTAYLYFSPGSEVQEKALPYFNALAQSSDGQLTVEVVDAAVRPDLAESQSVRENGWVVLARGDNTQKFKVGTELDRAERELKKLDGTVQKHLLKLVSDEHIVYWLTGHGEGSWRTRDDPLRKMALFKRALEDLNFRVSPLGTSEGSAVAVPDDAAMVVIAAPTPELFDEEEAALEAYLDGGGAMLVMVDPGAAALTPLLTKLGLTAGTAPIANASANVPLTGRGLADRVVLATNRFGSHEAITTVARHSTEEFLVLPTVLSITAVPDSRLDHTVLVRSYPDSWEDTNGDRQHGADEPGRVFELAQAVEPEAKDGFRAVVLGDLSVFSDYILDRSVGGADFAHDAASWLVGEADIIGGTEREEDVEIRHTHEGEAAWFWGTILGVPLLILVLGGITVNLRRRT